MGAFTFGIGEQATISNGTYIHTYIHVKFNQISYLKYVSLSSMQTIVQPGSMDSEAGIFALSYDLSGTRLLSCEADKTIKIYKEDEDATEDSHPIKDWKPDILKRRRF